MRNLFILFLCLGISIQQLHSAETTEPDSCKNLKKKTVWTIFDSLGASNVWQKALCDSTGMIFHSNLNTSNISYGGTSSGANVMNGSLGRAKKLVALKDSLPIDMVIFGNVNDISFMGSSTATGTINDEPWMQGEKVTAANGTFSSLSKAKEYCNENLTTILNNIPETKRAPGNILVFPYQNSSVNGYRILFKSSPTNSGNSFIKVGTAQFGIYVTPDMSPMDLAEKAAEYFYGSGWTVVNNGDASVTISYYKSSETVVSFNDNNTGIATEVTQCSSSKEYNVYFTGKTINDWCNTSYWTTTISLYSCYKGMFEYLKENLPTAEMYVMLPTYMKVDFNDTSIKNEDGTYNEEAYKQTNLYKQWVKLMNVQSSVAALYNIPVLDVHTESGITINNVEQYYNSGDVHPKKEGYLKWTDAIYKMFKRIYCESSIYTTIDSDNSSQTQILTYNDSIALADDLLSIENSDTVKVRELAYTRNYTGTWQSFYVPFAIKLSEISNDFDIAEINNIHQYDDDNNGVIDRTELEIIKLDSDETLKANYPYFIKAKKSGVNTIILQNTELVATKDFSIDCSSVKTKYVFTGTYNGVDGNEMYTNGYYGVSEGALKQAASSEAGLGAFRWYMKNESRNPGQESTRIIDIREVDETTGITEYTKEKSDDKYKVFDMYGKIVENPTNGIYIINGKKVIINK